MAGSARSCLPATKRGLGLPPSPAVVVLPYQAPDATSLLFSRRILCFPLPARFLPHVCRINTPRPGIFTGRMIVFIEGAQKSYCYETTSWSIMLGSPRRPTCMAGTIPGLPSLHPIVLPL